MANTQDPHDNFINEAKTYLECIEEIATKNLSSIPEPSVLDDLFRKLHSLKSGAAFFSYSKIESKTHDLESHLKILQGCCHKKESFYKEAQSFFEDFLVLKKNFEERDKDKEDRDAKTLENILLMEAQKRGETLYRVRVLIDPEEPLPFVRGNLLLSSFETLANVISTKPSFDDLNADFSELIIDLTSYLPKEELFKPLSIDGISQSSILRLDYESRRESSSFSEKSQIPYSSEANLKREHLSKGMLKIEEGLSDLKEIINRLDQKDKERGDSIIRAMEKQIREFSLVPFNSHYSRLKSFIYNSIDKEKYQIECHFSGGDFGINPHISEILFRVIIQLIRNSLVHGIETIDEKLQKGKSTINEISLHSEEENGQIHISYKDNGRGVDIHKVEQKLGRSLSEDETLLATLSKPGFSTASQVDFLAGRGVGLDLICHDIKDTLGGSLSLESEVHKGVHFLINLPNGQNFLTLVLVESAGHLIALPKRSLIQTEALNLTQVKKKSEGSLFYQIKDTSYPIYTLDGQLSSKIENLKDSYALLLENLGERAIFLVDDVVLEKDIKQEDFFLGDQCGTFLYNVLIKGSPVDFSYLSPGLIYS